MNEVLLGPGTVRRGLVSMARRAAGFLLGHQSCRLLRRSCSLVNFPGASGQGYIRHWDDAATAPYLYNPTTRVWVGYDDPQSMGEKAGFVRANGLGGVMFWELSGDDSQHDLLMAIRNGLTGPSA